MASVWKHPKSVYWFARFSDERGIQINRSTREKDRKRALVVAQGWEHTVQLARHGLLTTEKARAVLSEILERTTGGKESIRSEPTDKFFHRWLEHKEANQSVGTAQRYRGVIKKFLAHLGDRRGRPLTAIRPADVQGFLTQRARKRSTKTVVVDSKSLSAAFAYAQRQGLIDRNPVSAVELPKVKSLERQPFTFEQVKMLVRAAKGDWKTAILIGYYTGARLSDVVNLKWESIDFVGGTIQYTQRKTNEKVCLPLHAELQRHLESLADDSTDPHIIPGMAGKKPGGKTGLSAQFNAIMREAGIEQKREHQKSGRSFASLSFHSLRHSFESHLAAADVSPEMRRELAGRADEASQRFYTHTELAQMRSALAKLPKLLG